MGNNLTHICLLRGARWDSDSPMSFSLVRKKLLRRHYLREIAIRVAVCIHEMGIASPTSKVARYSEVATETRHSLSYKEGHLPPPLGVPWSEVQDPPRRRSRLGCRSPRPWKYS